ncbi:hypothetical protein [Mesorhizobium sp. KR9-304]|uniref:hypothetical protein n=1 Tax=Mesorhizobium sp. KR9-304 TaxID=3156614 RepID=UPI0032B49C0C
MLISALFFLNAVLNSATAQPVTGSTNNIGVETGPAPRFQIRFIEFYVKDETGIDFLGSDDVVFIVNAAQYELSVRRYSVNGDEWYTLETGEQCIMPAIDPDSSPNDIWLCQEAGSPAPITFNISAWEKTFNWPWSFGPGFSAPETDSDILPLGSTDRLKHRQTRIGQHHVDLPQAMLLEKMPRVGDKWPFTISLVAGCLSPGPCFDEEPWYDLTLEVARVGDASQPVPLDPNH